MRSLRTLWYDTRIRAGVLQLVLAGLVVGTIWWLINNTITNLAARGMNVSFAFFSQAARFPISEHVLDYNPSDSFAWAFVIGLINTLLVSAVVIVLSTIAGFLLALARRSRHPLLTGAAKTYIEVIRNTPLVVHLLFWYLLLITALPNTRHAFQPLPHLFLSTRGVFLPAFTIEGQAGWWLLSALFAAALCVLATIIPAYRNRIARHAGPVGPFAVIAAAATLFFGAWLAEGLSLSPDLPELRGLNYRGGIQLTPEFSALILGLVVYKTAFIAEIFRGGLNAVGHGQWEAGRAIGLKDRDTLRLIILPQALRVIVPPMASQYLTAVKNTTVALAVGYPDLSGIVGTVINQSGRALEGFSVMIVIYLVISLSVAGFMNWYNGHVALKGGR
ncbi:polar amino acid ABC transporter, inner membrane subunit [Rhizobium sp. CF080]|uniref:amino acid ABC transporter permease n=1 Tax=Rhizobium sp. (strain CF080) TaxID=1144310 RepID=UPI000271785B|nr:ABC transporter permease subunit [Rhizobium sp. CF080]EUB99657.1 polar amino acid ABC transporter, inner membrane subunit [Rhizobium sp. CF080]